MTPGWYDDPNGRFEFRYHNGETWTADVAGRGQRWVDPLGVGPTPRHGSAPRARPPHVAAVVPPGWTTAAGAAPARSPARIPSVLALVFGIVGAVLAIVPFLFVLGAAAAVAALVLGVLGVRRASASPGTSGAARSRAIAGIALAPVALGLCVLGFSFTRSILREFDRYLEPGLHTVAVGSCSVDDGVVTATGTIENGSDEPRTYTVVVEYRADGDLLARSRVEVAEVPAGATRPWRDASRLRGAAVTAGLAPVCSVDEVTGPFPFGAEP